VVVENGLQLSAYDPHPGKEFLASTDERFRPVHMATGPDGALYVADMYRGLVQHGAYITPYLKEQTLLRKLDQPVHRGRIWRIVPQGWKPANTKKLSEASPTELITYLAHADGWYRDMAQRLLIERNNKSIEKQLTDFALTANNPLGRFHALWTLEGLQLTNPQVLLPLVSDGNALVSTTALRLLEPLAQQSEQVRVPLQEVLITKQDNAPVEQILQIALISRVLDEKVSHTLLTSIVERYDTSALIRDAVLSSLYNQEFTFLKRLWESPQWQAHQPSRDAHHSHSSKE
jgi:hypothetical protein